MLPVSLTLVANLPTVSTTQVELVAKFAAGFFDTSGATGVIDTSSKFAPVSLTPVVNRDLRREVLKKFEMTLMYFQRLGGR